MSRKMLLLKILLPLILMVSTKNVSSQLLIDLDAVKDVASFRGFQNRAISRSADAYDPSAEMEGSDKDNKVAESRIGEEENEEEANQDDSRIHPDYYQDDVENNIKVESKQSPVFLAPPDGFISNFANLLPDPDVLFKSPLFLQLQKQLLKSGQRQPDLIDPQANEIPDYDNNDYYWDVQGDAIDPHRSGKLPAGEDLPDKNERLPLLQRPHHNSRPGIPHHNSRPGIVERLPTFPHHTNSPFNFNLKPQTLAQTSLELSAMGLPLRVQSQMEHVNMHYDDASQEAEIIPISDNVDTYNILITKNMTGGQSKPTIQYLPDAQVDAMLLNTSISSVNSIGKLKDVVSSAISAAIAREPIAIQEAIAQVIETPGGQDATVNVVNSTISDLTELESTINALLDSNIIYHENRARNTAVGRIPNPNGSIVNRLLNKTIGSDSIQVDSTSRTNIVNIFIINIINSPENQSGQPVQASDNIVPVTQDFYSSPPPLPQHSFQPPPPPQRDYGPPTNQFSPQTQPQPGFGPPPPSVSQQAFSPPSQPQPGYGPPPPVSQHTFSPPPQPQPGYGPPPSPVSQQAFSPPPQPQTGYGPPPSPVSQQAPSPASQPQVSYGPPPYLPHENIGPPSPITPFGASLFGSSGSTPFPLPPIIPPGANVQQLLNSFTVSSPSPPFQNNGYTGQHIQQTQFPGPLNPNNPNNPNGLNLNQNTILNLLPDFIKASTVPPIVPLYNSSYHKTLGKQPSVLGLLPNQVFGITNPNMIQNNTSSPGGIVLKQPIGNISQYFSKRPSADVMAATHNMNPSITMQGSGLYQHFVYTDPNIPQPDPVVSNPHPFYKRGFNSEILSSASENNTSNAANRTSIPHSVPAFSASTPVQHQSPSRPFNVISHPSNQVQNNDRNINHFNLAEDNNNRILALEDMENYTSDEIESVTEEVEVTRGNTDKSIASKGGLNIDNLMKAVAIGVIPSTVAIASATWPYWAPLLLGKRRRRRQVNNEEFQARASLSADWLSRLTGNVYSGASQSNKGQSRLQQMLNNPKGSKASKRKASSIVNSSTSTTNPPEISQEETESYNIEVVPSTETSVQENKMEDMSDLNSVSVQQLNIKGDIIRTTQKAPTTKRSSLFPATLITSSDDMMESSIAKVVDSLTTGSSNLQTVISTPLTALSDDGISESDENSPESTLVTNFLFNAMSSFSNNNGPLPPAGTNFENYQNNDNGMIDLDAISDPPSELVTGITNSPIVYFNGDPVRSSNSDLTSRPTYTFSRPSRNRIRNNTTNPSKPVNETNVTSQSRPPVKIQIKTTSTTSKPTLASFIIRTTEKANEINTEIPTTKTTTTKLPTKSPISTTTKISKPPKKITTTTTQKPTSPSTLQRTTIRTTAATQPSRITSKAPKTTTAVAQTTIRAFNIVTAKETRRPIRITTPPTTRKTTTTKNPTTYKPPVRVNIRNTTPTTKAPKTTTAVAQTTIRDFNIVTAKANRRPIRITTPPTTRKTTTTKKPTTYKPPVRVNIRTTTPATTTKTTTTTKAPTTTKTTTTTRAPTTTKATTTTTKATTTKTTTTTEAPTTTFKAPVRVNIPTTTTTTTTTTTEATTTTTTEAPGFIQSISNTIQENSARITNAVGFVSSVAIYGAAALMPLWLPIALGKRRRRDTGSLDLLDEVDILKMIESFPLEKEENKNNDSNGEILLSKNDDNKEKDNKAVNKKEANLPKKHSKKQKSKSRKIISDSKFLR